MTIHQQKGFTLIELLVVIVVIAILSALSILTYSGIQARATDTRLVSEESTLKKQVELLRADAGILACENCTTKEATLAQLGANNQQDTIFYQDQNQNTWGNREEIDFESPAIRNSIVLLSSLSTVYPQCERGVIILRWSHQEETWHYTLIIENESGTGNSIIRQGTDDIYRGFRCNASDI